MSTSAAVSSAGSAARSSGGTGADTRGTVPAGQSGAGQGPGRSRVRHGSGHRRHSTVGPVRRPVTIALAVAGLAALLAVAVTAGVLLFRSYSLAGPECTVPGDPAGATGAPQVELTAIQLQHASTINAVGPVSYTHLTLPTKRIV